MLLNMIKSGDFSAQTIISLLLYIIIILISLSVHELSHGYAAYLCGDSTARDLGRLTLNPLAHLDPIGTVMMLAFGFGYAKPVPINPRRFKHYKRDLCIVSLAGPFSNLLLAFVGTIVYYLFLIFLPYSAKMSIPGGVLFVYHGQHVALRVQSVAHSAFGRFAHSFGGIAWKNRVLLS